jgi:hypothetical protein
LKTIENDDEEQALRLQRLFFFNFQISIFNSEPLTSRRRRGADVLANLFRAGWASSPGIITRIPAVRIVR